MSIVENKEIKISTRISKRNSIKRGDIFYANLGWTGGSEQGGVRPVIIIQNDKGNYYSPNVIVAAITTSKVKQIKKVNIPTHVIIHNNFALDNNSVILLEQIRTLDKSKLYEKIGTLNKNEIKDLNEALRISIGL